VYIPAVSPAADDKSSASYGAAAADGPGACAASTEVSAWLPVLSKFHGVDGWPTSAIVLPGQTFS